MCWCAVKKLLTHSLTTDMGRKLGGLCPFFGGSWVPIWKMWHVRGLPPYQVASWSWWAKIGGGLCPCRGGAAGFQSNKMRHSWGLPACQVYSWSIQLFGHNMPTLQTEQRDRQTGQSDSNSIGRIFLQTVVQKYKDYGCSMLILVLSVF